MSYYIPILGAVIIAALFVLIMVGASVIIGPHRYNSSKYDVYECGVDAVDRPTNGGRISLKYFTIAMMFLIFDVETIFLFPWAVSFDALGLFGLVEMLLFVPTVFVAYAYVWRRRGLEWD